MAPSAGDKGDKDKEASQAQKLFEMELAKTNKVIESLGGSTAPSPVLPTFPSLPAPAQPQPTVQPPQPRIKLKVNKPKTDNDKGNLGSFGSVGADNNNDSKDKDKSLSSTIPVVPAPQPIVPQKRARGRPRKNPLPIVDADVNKPQVNKPQIKIRFKPRQPTPEDIEDEDEHDTDSEDEHVLNGRERIAAMAGLEGTELQAAIEKDFNLRLYDKVQGWNAEAAARNKEAKELLQHVERTYAKPYFPSKLDDRITEYLRSVGIPAKELTGDAAKELMKLARAKPSKGTYMHERESIRMIGHSNDLTWNKARNPVLNSEALEYFRGFDATHTSVTMGSQGRYTNILGDETGYTYSTHNNGRAPTLESLGFGSLIEFDLIKIAHTMKPRHVTQVEIKKLLKLRDRFEDTLPYRFKKAIVAYREQTDFRLGQSQRRELTDVDVTLGGIVGANRDLGFPINLDNLFSNLPFYIQGQMNSASVERFNNAIPDFYGVMEGVQAASGNDITDRRQNAQQVQLNFYHDIPNREQAHFFAANDPEAFNALHRNDYDTPSHNHEIEPRNIRNFSQATLVNSEPMTPPPPLNHTANSEPQTPSNRPVNSDPQTPSNRPVNSEPHTPSNHTEDNIEVMSQTSTQFDDALSTLPDHPDLHYTSNSSMHSDIHTDDGNQSSDGHIVNEHVDKEIGVDEEDVFQFFELASYYESDK